MRNSISIIAMAGLLAACGGAKTSDGGFPEILDDLNEKVSMLNLAAKPRSYDDLPKGTLSYNGVMVISDEATEPAGKLNDNFNAVGRVSIDVNVSEQTASGSATDFYSVSAHPIELDEQAEEISMTSTNPDDYNAQSIPGTLTGTMAGQDAPLQWSGSLTKPSGEVATYSFENSELDIFGDDAEFLGGSGRGTSEAEGRSVVAAEMIVITTR